MSSEDSLVYDTFVSKVYFFLRKEKLIQDLERLWYKIEQDSIKNNDYIEIISMIILLKLTNHSDYADQLFRYP